MLAVLVAIGLGAIFGLGSQANASRAARTKSVARANIITTTKCVSLGGKKAAEKQLSSVDERLRRGQRKVVKSQLRRIKKRRPPTAEQFSVTAVSRIQAPEGIAGDCTAAHQFPNRQGAWPSGDQQHTATLPRPPTCDRG